MPTFFPIVKRFASDENTVRRMLMVVLAFLMTHLITYQKLPFTDDYRFPLIPFAIFIIYGIFICEVNTWNYKRLLTKFGTRFNTRSIQRIVRTNLVACTVIFTVLTSLQMAIFQYIMNPFRFVGLLSVCLMISLIETGIFIVITFSKSKRGQVLTLNKLATQSEELTILRNNELLRFQEDQLSHLMHKDGCVFLFDIKGIRYTTQFESLTEVERKLSSEFFRANRQVLVSRRAISSVRKDTNNKLSLSLKGQNETVTVSRYKSRDLKNWYKS